MCLHLALNIRVLDGNFFYDPTTEHKETLGEKGQGKGGKRIGYLSTDLARPLFFASFPTLCVIKEEFSMQ